MVRVKSSSQVVRVEDLSMKPVAVDMDMKVMYLHFLKNIPNLNHEMAHAVIDAFHWEEDDEK